MARDTAGVLIFAWLHILFFMLPNHPCLHPVKAENPSSLAVEERFDGWHLEILLLTCLIGALAPNHYHHPWPCHNPSLHPKMNGQ